MTTNKPSQAKKPGKSPAPKARGSKASGLAPKKSSSRAKSAVEVLPTPPSHTETPDQEASANSPRPEILEKALAALSAKKVENLMVLRVNKLVSYTDYFVIGTGNSAPHVQAMADAVAMLLKVPHKKGARVEGDTHSTWVLIDGGDFIVHLFQPEARRYYNIEDLWTDAPREKVEC